MSVPSPPNSPLSRLARLVEDFEPRRDALSFGGTVREVGAGYARVAGIDANVGDILFNNSDARLRAEVVQIDKNEALGIVEAALRMANALQRPVVAEGIESVEIGFMLARLGCQFGQGFGIARPMPAEQVLPWLTQWQGEDLWHPLGKESLAASVKYDLEVAMFSLRLWLNHLLASLSGAAGGTSPPLDEYQCQFHRWYHGIGRARYGGNPNYAFIQAQHYQIHQLGAKLADLAASGQTREALALRGELDALGEEMIRLLRRLERP